LNKITIQRRLSGILDKAESCHAAWRDSVAPKHVARLNLAMSAKLASVVDQSRQSMWCDPSGSFGVTKRASS